MISPEIDRTEIRLALEELVLSAYMKVYKTDFKINVAYGALEFNKQQIRGLNEIREQEEGNYVFIKKVYDRFIGI